MLVSTHQATHSDDEENHIVVLHHHEIQGDRQELDVFEMIITHLFFNKKKILLQKNHRNCMPFELLIMTER
jgi:CMP-N-acetylneuraminic acid synthetase